MKFASFGFVLCLLLGVVVERAVAAPAAAAERGDMEGASETQPAFGVEPSPRPARDTGSGDTGSGDTQLTFLLFVNFTSAEEFGGTCFAGRTAGLGDTTLTLEKRYPEVEEEWKLIQRNISLDHGLLDFSVPKNFNETGSGECIEYRLVQEEHGGGSCNCWTLSNPGRSAIGIPFSSMNDTFDMCNTTASQRRVFSCIYCLNGENTLEANCTDMPKPNPPREKPFNVSESCSDVKPHLNVDFQIIFNGNRTGCDTVTNFNEGVEFAVRLDDDEVWIPLAVIFRDHGTSNGITLGNLPNLVIRDYPVDPQNQFQVNETDLFNVSLRLCDFNSSFIQFRWLQTSRFGGIDRVRDLWGLDDLQVSYVQENGMEAEVFSESFDSEELNSTIWPMEGIRDANLSTNCTVDPSDQALIFGFASGKVNVDGGQRFGPVVSRIIKTSPLPISITVSTDPPMTDITPTGDANFTPTGDETMSDATMSTPVTTIAPTESQLLANARMALMNAEADALKVIRGNQQLLKILNAPPREAINMLGDVLDDNTRQDDAFAIVYLFGSILNRTEGGQIHLPINETIRVTSGIIRRTRGAKNQTSMALNIVGASLLNSMDTFLFDHFDRERSLELGDIGVRSVRFPRGDGDGSGFQVPINSTRLSRLSSPMAAIEIPQELIRNVFQNLSSMIRDPDSDPADRLRFVSFVFENVSKIVPNVLPGRNNTELASGVVSTAIQCRNGRCPTDSDNLDPLDKPVRIIIQHSDMVQERLERDNQSEVLCVFMEFLGGGSPESILSAGQWSQENCERNEFLSDNSTTVCECTHLTHFAILLSARPLNISDANRLALEVIGYVGVAVSLAAMTITILTFVALKALHTMRNFIHINLCVNLGIAQIVFVAGVDKVGGANAPVPAHCQAVAVLVHYFFLVSFMWMLMEGVVLYVVLVKVFVKHKKLYMLAFTVVSYGAPLLYLGLLTLPIGFALSDAMPSYGYQEACFLNPTTHFIWAFIAPVILILLVNCGFFIMAASIMWRHQKKQSGDKSNMATLKNWLKAAVSLVVIMGLTWIMGVLIVEVEELLSLAYIYTIMVAFQGFFIFIIFVLLSKSVREAYGKWWRTKVNESDFLSKYFGEKFTLSTSRTASASKEHKGSSSSKGPSFKLEHSEQNLGSSYTPYDATSSPNQNGAFAGKGSPELNGGYAGETKIGSPELNGGYAGETKSDSPELNGGPTVVGEETKESSPEEVGSIGSETKIDLGEREDEMVGKFNGGGGRTGSEQIAYMIMKKRLPNSSTHNTAL